MKQKRISLVPVEDVLQYPGHQPNNTVSGSGLQTDPQSFTVGLVFLTDLFFLLRLPNFWELLAQPVSTFLDELYGYD